MKVSEFLLNNAIKFPQKPAIIFKEKTLTFQELKNISFSLAGSLEKLGVKKNTKVGIFLPNSPEYILSYLAVYSLGGAVVPLDFIYTEDEIRNFLGHSDTEILIAKERKDLDLKRIKEDLNLKEIIFLEDFHSLIEENKDFTPKEEILYSDYSTIFYTSGTTGRPKGVLLNYKHLEGPAKSIEYFLNISDKDILLCSIPLSHSGGWVYLLLMLYFGTTLILQDRFIPLEFLKDIERYRVTLFWIVPAMYVALLTLKEFEKFDLQSLRYVVVFGAPSSPDLLKRFHKFCPQAYLLNGWGMTETSPPNTVLPLGSERIESVGKPLPWIEIKVFDEESREVEIGEIGELVIKGWPVMEGYYKDPQLTSEVMRGGWFHTGDLAKFDREGFLYIVGRKKEMIKVAGEIVFEPEIESVIHKHSDVAEVAVIGVPDKLRGEVPKAFVVLKEGSQITEDDLRHFCRQHLAHFKIPHYFEFLKELPKTRTGKIDKTSLKKKVG